MSAVCPNGHTSEAEDYCDTCGSPIDASAQPAAGGGPARAPESGASTSGVSTSGVSTPGVSTPGVSTPGVSTPGVSEAGAPSESLSGAASVITARSLSGSASGSTSGSTSGSASGAGVSGAAAAMGPGSSLDLDVAEPGEPAGAQASPAAAPAPTGLECPNCHTANADGALFCEACGYDFTTGAMPRDASGAAMSALEAASAAVRAAREAGASGATPESEPFEWLAEVWVDPDWYQTQEAEDPCPSPGLPVIMPLRHRSVLLGRVSVSRNTHPEVDLSSDPGVSRRHAQLTTDGTRWFVEDLGSSNGTYVGQASGPLPEHPIAVGPKTELGDDDRLYVGAWTRVVVRRATPDEVEAYA